MKSWNIHRSIIHYYHYTQWWAFRSLVPFVAGFPPRQPLALRLRSLVPEPSVFYETPPLSPWGTVGYLCDDAPAHPRDSWPWFIVLSFTPTNLGGITVWVNMNDVQRRLTDQWFMRRIVGNMVIDLEWKKRWYLLVMNMILILHHRVNDLILLGKSFYV